MGKRSNFERREADFYPTPRAAVLPLIPYLRGIRTFAEPCAGDGALVRHLESFGLRCVYAGDIRTGQDALALDHYGAADAIITNPPWSRDVLHGLIAHFQNIAPTWLLLDADWQQTQPGGAVPAPLLGHRGDRPREMDRGIEAHRQGQRLLGTCSIQAHGRPRLPLARPGRGDPIHGAPECASNAASVTSRSVPVRGSARRRAGSSAYRKRLSVTSSVTPARTQHSD